MGKEYEYEKLKESYKDETVYFCGLLPLHWGHFLIDFICRLYVLIENDEVTSSKFLDMIDAQRGERYDIREHDYFF